MRKSLPRHVAEVLRTDWWRNVDLAMKRHCLSRWAVIGRDNRIIQGLVREQKELI